MNRRALACLDDLEVLAYLERRIPGDRLAEVERHLERCRACLRLIDQLRAMAAVVTR